MKNKLKYFYIMILIVFLVSGCTKEDQSPHDLNTCEINSEIVTEVGEQTESDSNENILWMTSQELEEQRSQYYEQEDLTMEIINTSVLDEKTTNFYQLQCNEISSYIAINEKISQGVTLNTSTGEVMQLNEVWIDDEGIWDVIKKDLLEQTMEMAQEEILFVLVENYEDIINKMDRNPEDWYWYMNASGIVIEFRQYVMRPAKLTYVLPYTDWDKYIKEEYLFNANESISSVSINCTTFLDEEKYVKIIDNSKLKNEAILQTETIELKFGEEYGDCSKAFIINDSNNGFYLLLSTEGISGYDDGSVLVYYILNDEIALCDCISNSALINIESRNQIVIATLINKSGDLIYEYMIYKMDGDGKLISV